MVKIKVDSSEFGLIVIAYLCIGGRADIDSTKGTKNLAARRAKYDTFGVSDCMTPEDSLMPFTYMGSGGH